MSEFTKPYEDNEKVAIPELSPKDQLEKEKKLEQEAARAEAERDSIEAIRERLEHAQQNQEKVTTTRQETPANETGHLVSTGLRSHASNQMLQRAQRQLSPSSRAFSKVIHQPVVDAVSNAAEVTVARPYSLLVGGLFSAISSLVVLYISRHYGYEYNYLIGLVSFGGGFILGLVGEAFYRLFKNLFKHS